MIAKQSVGGAFGKAAFDKTQPKDRQQPGKGALLSVLILVHRYLPGYKSGGPLRSIEQIVAQLGGDFDFSVLTTDRDTGDDVPSEDVEAGTWGANGMAAVKYLSPKQTRHRAKSAAISAHAHDLLCLNSFLSRQLSISPRIARHLGQLPYKPVIIAHMESFHRAHSPSKSRKRLPF